MSISRTKGIWAAAQVALALIAFGCEPPPIVPAVAPGVDNRENLMPKESAAEANGEMGMSPGSAVLPGLVPALPTAKGETKTTPSGVTYETITEGTGATVKAGQMITVHYIGTLDDGKVFDSSRKKGKAATFSIGTGAVVKGWDEGIPGMKIGEVRKLTIPPVVGYGALGSKTGSIPPNATLHFEVEMIKAE